MKKYIKKVLILIIVFIVIYLLFGLFKNKHSYEYELVYDDIKFNVSETFSDDKYHFLISSGDYKFSYYIDNYYGKKKKVLNDIKYVKDNDLICIFPVFQDDRFKDITCGKDDKYYSYYMLKDNLLVSDFFTSINKDYNFIDQDLTPTNIENMEVYLENISDDEFIYIWKYNGFYRLTDTLENLNLFDVDNYYNSLGINLDKYYLFPDYNQKYRFNKMYVLNLETAKIKEINMDMNISFDSYYAGSFNKEIYLIDLDNKKEYVINPKKRRIKEVGSVEDKGIYFNNGKKEYINFYEFLNKKIKFKDEIDIPIKYQEIYYGKDYIYVLDISNNFIRYDQNSNTSVTLFNISNITSISISSDNIYFIKEDTLYSYSNTLKKIIKYDEFKYNSNNIYTVYKK